MAGEAIAFKQALMRCGISEATALFFSEHTGLDDCANLAMIPKKDLESLLVDTQKAARDDYARRLATHNASGAVGDAPTPHRFTGLSLHHIRAFRLWAKARDMMNAEMASGAFLDSVLRTYVQLREEVEIRQDQNGGDIEPCKLIQKDWRKFDNKLRAYLRNLIGAAGIPLSYLIREHDEVTPAIRAAAYDSEMDRLIACVAFDPDKSFYRMDNQRLADKIVSLVQDGDCHGQVNAPARSKDGRWMYLELQRTARGDNSKLQIFHAAMERLNSLHYDGRSRSYTLAKHVSNHIDCHNEIVEAGSTVEESHRVQILVNSINDPKLLHPCNEVRGDSRLMNSFNDAKNKIMNFAVSDMGKSGSSRRGISQVSQDDGELTSAKKKAKIKSGAHFPPHEFHALTRAEKREVIANRKKKRGGGGGKSGDKQVSFNYC